MKTEIDPRESNRSEAFRLWMTAPVPMVTLVKTQMDGGDAARFLERLQKEIEGLRIKS